MKDISLSTTLPIKLSSRQISYLREVKAEHGLSMASQIRTMIQRTMYGIAGQSVSRANLNDESGRKRTRPITTGNAAYSGCVKELSKIFEKRGKLK